MGTDELDRSREEEQGTCFGFLRMATWRHVAPFRELWTQYHCSRYLLGFFAVREQPAHFCPSGGFSRADQNIYKWITQRKKQDWREMRCVCCIVVDVPCRDEKDMDLDIRLHSK